MPRFPFSPQVPPGRVTATPFVVARIPQPLIAIAHYDDSRTRWQRLTDRHPGVPVDITALFTNNRNIIMQIFLRGNQPSVRSLAEIQALSNFAIQSGSYYYLRSEAGLEPTSVNVPSGSLVAWLAGCRLPVLLHLILWDECTSEQQTARFETLVTAPQGADDPSVFPVVRRRALDVLRLMPTDGRDTRLPYLLSTKHGLPWTTLEYVAGPHLEDPLMGWDRAETYRSIGMTPEEARRLEFHPTIPAPTDDALGLLAALNGSDSL